MHAHASASHTTTCEVCANVAAVVPVSLDITVTVPSPAPLPPPPYLATATAVSGVEKQQPLQLALGIRVLHRLWTRGDKHNRNSNTGAVTAHSMQHTARAPTNLVPEPAEHANGDRQPPQKALSPTHSLSGRERSRQASDTPPCTHPSDHILMCEPPTPQPHPIHARDAISAVVAHRACASAFALPPNSPTQARPDCTQLGKCDANERIHFPVRIEEPRVTKERAQHFQACRS